MTWSECIIAAHTAVTDQVSHGGRMKSKRYFVWQEDKPNDFEADGKHLERAVTGTTDLFTNLEFDPWKDELEKQFNESEFIAWSANQPQFEADRGIWHYEWSWEVAGCG